jgi:hypothetical protein
VAATVVDAAGASVAAGLVSSTAGMSVPAVRAVLFLAAAAFFVGVAFPARGA